MKKKPKLLIFSSEDSIWSLSIWNNTIPILKERFEVVGIFLFPSALKGMQGLTLLEWYLRTLGPLNFLKLAMLSVLVSAGHFLKGLHWTGLSKREQVPISYFKSFKEEDLPHRIKACVPEYAVATVDQIIPKSILELFPNSLVNKHTALLPSCRGLWPVFWSKLNQLPLGITFHLMTQEIDGGPILLQHPLPADYRDQTSMIRIHLDLAQKYPGHLMEALKQLSEQRFITASLPPSYFSLPSRREVLYFQKHHAIVTFRDLFYAASTLS